MPYSLFTWLRTQAYVHVQAANGLIEHDTYTKVTAKIVKGNTLVRRYLNHFETQTDQTSLHTREQVTSKVNNKKRSIKARMFLD